MPTPLPPIQEQPKKKHANIIIPFVAAVVGLGLGYFLASLQTSGGAILPTYSKQACYEEAAQMVAELGLLPEAPEEARVVSGIVQSVNGRTLTIQAQQLVANPFLEQAPEVRTVTLSEGAAITSQRQIDQATLDAALASGDESIIFNPFITAEASISEIKEGDSIFLTAQEDVLYAESFTATEASFTSPLDSFTSPEEAGGIETPEPPAPQESTQP